MIGLSTSGSISFGWALVAGKKRVPRPAAGKTALRTFAAGIRFSSWHIGRDSRDEGLLRLGGIRPIAGAGARHGVAGRLHGNLDLPKSAVQLLIQRRIADEVLIAEIACDLVGNRIDFGQSFGIENFAAGTLDEFVESPLRSVGFGFHI